MNSSTATKIAFKEWAVIVDLLGTGDQVLILRKGGIHENRGGFQVEHRGFFLFPTLFHQQGESVVPEMRERSAKVLAGLDDAGSVPIHYWAEVAGTWWLTDWQKVGRLARFHAWTESVIRDRFGWGKDEGIFAIATKVFRLAAPRTIPMLKEYGGCKSWVEIADATAPPLEGMVPVLKDSDFEERLNQIRDGLA